MKNVSVLIFALFTLFAPASSGASGTDELPVFVSIPPMAFFVERVGGARVDVHVLVGPGQSPETFEPTSKQLVELSGSRVFFSIGVPFEEAILDRIRNNFKRVEIIDAGAGIELRESKSDHGIDPHVWLDPELAVIIAGNVRAALERLDPGHEKEYESNAAALINDLTEVDKEIRRMLAPLKGDRFYVFHPAYGYFARAYGLVQVPIEEGGASPGSRQLAELIDRAKAQKVRAIFIQPQYSSASAKTIANEIGADIIEMDPLARDYLANLEDIARKIKEACDEK